MNAHKLNIACFAFVILMLSGINLFYDGKPTVSVIENRTLSTMPDYSFEELKSGNFFKNFDSFFGDNFIFRENFVAMGQSIQDLRGLHTEGDLQLVATYGDNTFDEVNVELENEDPVTILFKDNVALTLHKFYPEKAKSYADALNSFALEVDDSVKIYSVLIPDRIEFESDERLKSLSDSEKDTINYVDGFLSEKVQAVNIYDALKNQSGDYLFFKTDHHWTALGAYYGYRGFINTIGEQPVELEAYDTFRLDNFLGSRYALNEQLANNPDFVDVYEYKDNQSFEYAIYRDGTYEPAPLLDMRFKDENNKYGVFLGGDTPLSKITTSNDNNKKILVIKDSYGNAFSPFLAPHYSEVYIVDPRYVDGAFEVHDIIKNNGIQEVLFLNTVSVTTKNSFPTILGDM